VTVASQVASQIVHPHYCTGAGDGTQQQKSSSYYRKKNAYSGKIRDQSLSFHPFRGTFLKAGRPLGILLYVTLLDV
jgi:hypothetical protein